MGIRLLPSRGKKIKGEEKFFRSNQSDSPFEVQSKEDE